MKIKEKKNKKAISLIVLVIIIIVLSILAATVIISISNTNVIEEANKTVFKSDMSNYKEVFEMYVTTETMKDNSFDSSSLDGTYATKEEVFKDIFGEVSEKYQDGLIIQGGKLVYKTEDETEKEILSGMDMEYSNKISKSESFVGYYADVNGDGTVDGVIFADLAVGGTNTWEKGEMIYSFSYDAVSNKNTLKDYVLTGESYSGAFSSESMPVLKATGSGEDRFYVMALEDFTTTINGTAYSKFYWYYNGNITDYSTVTSSDFGKGKLNTQTMISKWNNNGASTGAYGARKDGDIWGAIETQANAGWFVPSLGEWQIFVTDFSEDIMYNSGIRSMHLTSSLRNSGSCDISTYYPGSVSNTLDDELPVRLAKYLVTQVWWRDTYRYTASKNVLKVCLK